jgi:hypothetical protein
MRKPLPPFVLLSQDGSVAAYQTDTELHLVNIEDEIVTRLPLPHGAKTLALSPHASVGIVAGYEKLSLFRYKPEALWLGTVTIPAPLYRVAVGEDCLVAATLAFSEAQSTLCIWRGEQLDPILSGQGEPLGMVAPYHIRLDEKTNHILLWGLTGRGAFSGDGEPFVRLFSVTQNSVKRQWAGEQMPFKRRGFLFPLQDGGLGIYDREKLIVLPLDIHTHNMLPVAEYAFNNLERVAISPNGTYIVWLWHDAQERYHLCTAQLDTGAVLNEITFDHLGHFPMIAIDNDGHASLTFSEKPDRILAFIVEENQLVKHIDRVTV